MNGIGIRFVYVLLILLRKGHSRERTQFVHQCRSDKSGEPPCRQERQERSSGVFSGTGAFGGLAAFLRRLIRTAL